jgi:hypothetical protein
LSSSWWCSSWSISVGAFFLDLFSGGILSCFSADLRWVPMLGGSERSDRIPKHMVLEQESQELRKGDKESPKARTCLKSCEHLYTCPRTPFYRETNGLFTSRKYPQI